MVAEEETDNCAASYCRASFSSNSCMMQILSGRRASPDLFFVLSYSHVSSLDYGGAPFHTVSANVRAVAARCELSYAHRPRLSQQGTVRTKVITKGNKKRKRPPAHTILTIR
jgi:hypothetical protein